MERAGYLARLRGLIKIFGKDNLVYFDESGFQKHSYRPHGWAVRGKKIYGDVSGNNRKDVNLIMAQKGKKWLAPVLFTGSCTTAFVNTWIKNFLVPELKNPSVIIMDNARFHNKSQISEILHQHGHILLPLPKYSPDFNPIEQSFAILKKRRAFSGKSLEQLLL
jgi:hypothetical protein